MGRKAEDLSRSVMPQAPDVVVRRWWTVRGIVPLENPSGNFSRSMNDIFGMLSKHHPSLRGVVALSLSAVVLVGCGSSSSSKPAATTVGGADTTAAADDPPASTAAPATPASVVNNAATISVTVGTDDFQTTGAKSVFSVPKGTAVTIEITDPNADNEFHLHGYDVEASGKKGEKATIAVTADQTGQFDLESHTTSKVLVVLLVTP